MTERWRKPATIVAVENDSSTILAGADGRFHPDLAVTVDEETFERMRLGYLCMNCREPFASPFPEACRVCGYEVRARQQQEFEQSYEGDKWIGPRTSISQELDRLDDQAERVTAEKRRPGRIWLPGD